MRALLCYGSCLLLSLLLSGCRGGDCALIGLREGALSTQAAHRCLSLCLGTARAEAPATLHYRGCLLGLTHNTLAANDVQRLFVDERCTLAGASLQLLAQTHLGPLSGAAISGCFSGVSELNGLQLSLLANGSEQLRGVQLAVGLNRTSGSAKGLQVGLFNVADELSGVQVGLLNINRAGWVVPLLNLGW